MNPNMDPQAVISKIYPILVFRDKVVRTISAIVSKIPGLEALIDKITETVTLFVFSLLAPYILPIIKTASEQLKTGSSAVVHSSADHQYEPWSIPTCTDPTHSMLSKGKSPSINYPRIILSFSPYRCCRIWWSNAFSRSNRKTCPFLKY
jgi:hypothetical protein